jgi:hypothetical protein
VLLGSSHRVPLRGLGLSGGESFATNLGTVPLDLDAAAERLRSMRGIQPAKQVAASLAIARTTNIFRDSVS